MKNLEILLEDDLDTALERRAEQERLSKAELVRRTLAERFAPLPPLAMDPLAEMVGVDDFEPQAVDDVVYR